jgi:hypothetical protein
MQEDMLQAGAVAQVVERLPKALSSNPSTTKKKKKKKRRHASIFLGCQGICRTGFF